MPEAQAEFQSLFLPADPQGIDRYAANLPP